MASAMQAQSRDNLCVWYSIHKTEQPFIFSINGEVQGIEKTAEGTTEVLVQEEPSAGDDGLVGYQLDDNLVRFIPPIANNASVFKFEYIFFWIL